ncbi:unnamed protein product [Ilex paraguariensis]|uniref:WAT1-related protein n=1 Tax=Ilex paraguariensis TaxID=185542 RepID=A0ABC8UM20_9AQUA
MELPEFGYHAHRWSMQTVRDGKKVPRRLSNSGLSHNRSHPSVYLLTCNYHKATRPVVVAMSKPLAVFIAAVMGITFLGDALYIGSVIGAAIIAVGFYAVMWGKAKEEKDVKGQVM